MGSFIWSFNYIFRLFLEVTKGEAKNVVKHLVYVEFFFPIFNNSSAYNFLPYNHYEVFVWLFFAFVSIVFFFLVILFVCFVLSKVLVYFCLKTDCNVWIGNFYMNIIYNCQFFFNIAYFLYIYVCVVMSPATLFTQIP